MTDKQPEKVKTEKTGRKEGRKETLTSAAGRLVIKQIASIEINPHSEYLKMLLEELNPFRLRRPE